jgi:hypothetical protein
MEMHGELDIKQHHEMYRELHEKLPVIKMYERHNIKRIKN